MVLVVVEFMNVLSASCGVMCGGGDTQGVYEPVVNWYS